MTVQISRLLHVHEIVSSVDDGRRSRALRGGGAVDRQGEPARHSRRRDDAATMSRTTIDVGDVGARGTGIEYESLWPQRPLDGSSCRRVDVSADC